MISTITLDTYKQQIGSGDAFNLSDSFNGRVGDEQVPLVVQFKERGLAHRFEDGLVPFLTGFVGSLDENDQVTAETGEAVSYVGTSDDIVGLGRVKMNLPGTMFPQEGYFYGYLGLQTADKSKRVSTFTVWFHVYNGNPDMFVNKSPFRTELQKVLDAADALVNVEDSQFKSAMIDWKQQVTALLTDLNGDYVSIQTTVTAVKTSLTMLEEKIKSDGLLTQDEFDAQIKIIDQSITKALATLQQTLPVSDNLLLGSPVSVENQSALANIKSVLDDTKFNFVFIADTHFDKITRVPDKPNNFSLGHLNDALYLDNAVDAIISGGDNIDGWTDSLAGQVNLTNEYVTELLFGSDNHSDKFILKGNHDDASGRLLEWYRGDRTYLSGAPALISNTQLERIYHNSDCLFGEQRQVSSNYFYKDYPSKKVRLIGLDSNDTPDSVLNSDGRPKYYGIKNMGYSEEQLKWLADVALQNVPADFVTIIVSHIQADTLVSDTDSYFNQTCLNQIINDFIKGTSSQVTSNVADWGVDLTTNFTTQGKRDLAGYFHGHQHKETFSNDLGFNNIGITCSLGTTDAWNVISLDQDKRNIKLLGFGRATTRSFDY